MIVHFYSWNHDRSDDQLVLERHAVRALYVTDVLLFRHMARSGRAPCEDSDATASMTHVCYVASMWMHVKGHTLRHVKRPLLPYGRFRPMGLMVLHEHSQPKYRVPLAYMYVRSAQITGCIPFGPEFTVPGPQVDNSSAFRVAVICIDAVFP